MKVSIVGAGRVGTTLAAAISAAGHELTAVVSRSQASAEAATALAGTGRASIDLTHAFAADLLLLTVPDDQIGGVARRLDEAGCPETLGVCHTSGACSSELLAPLPRRASAHPLQTFAEARSALGEG